MFVYFNGLILGLSLIIALGPQNIFLIKQGVQKNHPLLSTIVCFISDFMLVCCSVTGLHNLLILRPVLQIWLMALGCCFLLFYAFRALNNAFSTQTRITQHTIQSQNKLQVILLSLGFSLLNPHAIIDSLIIIGGGSSEYPDHQNIFLLGVGTSSLLWFSSLTFTATYFSDVLSRATVWKGIELLSGGLMTFIGVKLGIQAVFLISGN